MKSTTFALGSLLAATAFAQPHKHQAFHNQHKRDAAVEWVTDIEYTTELVLFTTTIWVPAGYVAPTEAAAAPSVAVADAPVAAATTLSPVYVAPAVVASTEAPAATTAAPVVAAASPDPTPVATPSPIVAAEDAAPVASVAEVAAPVAAATTAAAPAVASVASTSSSSSSAVGSTTGSCQGEANLCAGDITYYDTGYPGYGACGEQTDGTKVAVIALPYEMMGTLSNNNPYCGRVVTINYGSKSIQATVVDKCMGCEARSIDLSHYAFDQLADESIGRTQATWYFSD